VTPWTLHKVDELKAMLREQKLPVSGRKRELVDGWWSNVGAPKASPSLSDMLPLRKARSTTSVVSASRRCKREWTPPG
jgi:hypothetical protein